MTDIPSFYAGRSVLLTGGTGFMGKVILEKLLRACPEIKAVYLLVRPRRDVPGPERVREFLANDLYDKLRKEQPDFAAKIVPINGELTEDNLGMSAADAEMLANTVSIVIHSAATVKFTEKIK